MASPKFIHDFQVLRPVFVQVQVCCIEPCTNSDDHNINVVCSHAASYVYFLFQPILFFLSLVLPLDLFYVFWDSFFKFNSNFFTEHIAFSIHLSGTTSKSASQIESRFPSPPLNFFAILQCYIFTVLVLTESIGLGIEEFMDGNLTRHGNLTWHGNLTGCGWIWTIDLP